VALVCGRGGAVGMLYEMHGKKDSHLDSTWHLFTLTRIRRAYRDIRESTLA
jgi:hypothetical protein